MERARVFFFELPPLVTYSWRIVAMPYNTTLLWVVLSVLLGTITMGSGEPVVLVLGINLAVAAVVAFADLLRTRALGRAIDAAREVERRGDTSTPTIHVPSPAFHRPLAIVLLCLRVASLGIQLYSVVAADSDVLRLVLLTGMLTSLANIWTEIPWIHAAGTDASYYLDLVAGFNTGSPVAWKPDDLRDPHALSMGGAML